MIPEPRGEDSLLPSAGSEGAHVVDSVDYPSHGDITDGYGDEDFVHLPAESVLRLGLELGDVAATHVPED